MVISCPQKVSQARFSHYGIIQENALLFPLSSQNLDMKPNHIILMFLTGIHTSSKGCSTDDLPQKLLVLTCAAHLKKEFQILFFKISLIVSKTYM